jgi:acyl-coenzyme A thioesterase PaaI-like protein
MSEILTQRLCAALTAALTDAARQRLTDTARPVGPADLHIVFGGADAEALTARSTVTGGGNSVCFCEAELHDAEGQLVARAMATFRYR